MILRHILLASAALAAGPAAAQSLATMDRNGSLVSVEAYGPNIVRVTLSLDRKEVEEGPGYGISAKPDASGWTHSGGASGDLFTSSALRVTVNAQPWPKPPSQMQRYFAPSLPPVSITIGTPDGREITRMNGWEMAPHDREWREDVQGGRKLRRHCRRALLRPRAEPGGHRSICAAARSTAGTITTRRQARRSACPSWSPTRAMASSGTMPRRRRSRRACTMPRAGSPRSASACRSSSSPAGHDEIYAGYAKLTGETPLPPKAAFGLIQSKARYESQRGTARIAEGYRSRGYPLDVMVLDWFYWTRMGQLDIDRTYFPDPAGMNKTAHDWACTRSSASGRASSANRATSTCSPPRAGCCKDAEGQVVGRPAVRSDRAGALLDSTNPEAREWFWGKIRDNIASEGFDWFWLDETEPDLVPTAISMRSVRATAITTSSRWCTPAAWPTDRRATGPTSAI
jgi:alpha-D-xyloside xylohydrolase